MDKLGRYEVFGEVGRGAMGTVYRARDPKIDRIVAIKTIGALGANPSEHNEYRNRFFREAQAAGKLSHPGIVTIYDVGEEETTRMPYIVMEYIAGQTLESLLNGETTERPSLVANLDLVKQLAEALDYAHAQKIVHRDIKPANIIVTADGRAKITDFGIAKLTQSEFTVSGQFMGTPSYASPEQLKGEAVDGRSDLFSLGVILYWMLTGEKAFTGDTSTILAKILYQDPVPVTQCNASLRPEFESVARRALAKDPAARYQHGKELAEDLDDLRSGRPLRRRSRPFAKRWGEKTVVQKLREPRSIEKTVRLHAPDLSSVTAPQSFSAGVSGGAAANEASNRKHLGRWAALAVSAVFLVIFLVVHPTNRPGETASLFPVVKPEETAILHLVCYHSLNAAEISISVDNALVFEGKLAGEADSFSRLFQRRTGPQLSRIVHVSAGRHTVRVQIQPRGEGDDQTKEIEADFTKDDRRTLEISFGRRNNSLSLSWQN